jgi:hypothetical protein
MTIHCCRHADNFQLAERIMLWWTEPRNRRPRFKGENNVKFGYGCMNRRQQKSPVAGAFLYWDTTLRVVSH